MNRSNYTHLCMHPQFKLSELVDLMVALGHMEKQCNEWIQKRDDATNRNNLERVTILKDKVTQQLTERIMDEAGERIEK